MFTVGHFSFHQQDTITRWQLSPSMDYRSLGRIQLAYYYVNQHQHGSGCIFYPTYRRSTQPKVCQLWSWPIHFLPWHILQVVETLDTMWWWQWGQHPYGIHMPREVHKLWAAIPDSCNIFSYQPTTSKPWSPTFGVAKKFPRWQPSPQWTM